MERWCRYVKVAAWELFLLVYLGSEVIGKQTALQSVGQTDGSVGTSV